MNYMEIYFTTGYSTQVPTGNVGDGITMAEAVGETAFEGLFGTEYPGCGVAISAGSYYGRVAGENAANEAKAN